MNNPNNAIREYFKEALSYPVYTTRQQTRKDNVCFLIMNQDNTRTEETKCNKSVVQDLVIEAIQKMPRFGNIGNLTTIDQLTSDIYQAFDDMQITGYHISEKNIIDNAVTAYDANEIINRNILTINFKIQEDGTN